MKLALSARAAVLTAVMRERHWKMRRDEYSCRRWMRDLSCEAL